MSEHTVTGTDTVLIPTPWGEFEVQAWRGRDGEHLSMRSHGQRRADNQVASATDVPPLVRIHSECATGDIFGSYRCDCGEQLDSAMREIAANGGVLVYLRGQEGRGIGLFDKIRAYHEQDRGADTVDANTVLGLPVDARRYDDAAGILHALGIDRVRLLSNNPHKDRALSDLGIAVSEVVPLVIPARPQNARYLDTKRERMAHRLPHTLLHP